MKPVIIMSTYPDQKSVKKTAKELVKKRLTACVNISKISSIYSWKGKIEDTSEFLAIFKTTQKNKNSLKKVYLQTKVVIIGNFLKNLKYLKSIKNF